MTDTPDPRFQAARARLDEAKAKIQAAWALRDQDPYSVGEAASALVYDQDLLFVLGFPAWKQLLEAELPQLDAELLLRAASLVRRYSRAEVTAFGWHDIDVLDRILTLEGQARMPSDLGALRVKVLNAAGHPVWIRFADRAPGQLDAALAALEKSKPLPGGGPPKAPVPTPPSEPEPTPTPTAAGPLPATGVSFGAGFVLVFIGPFVGGDHLGAPLVAAGLLLMVASLIVAHDPGVAQWAAWGRARPGFVGSILGWALGLLGRFRGQSIGVLGFCTLMAAWGAWRDREVTISGDKSKVRAVFTREEPTEPPLTRPTSAPRVVAQPIPASAPVRDDRPTGRHDQAVWLPQAIPENAVIEFDTWTDNPQGDIRLEAWGDGHSLQNEAQPLFSTGYLFVLGGHANTVSFMAKGSEAGSGRISRQGFRVEPGRHYHWKVFRQGSHVGWFIDGKPFLGTNDPAPLLGPGHAYLALGGGPSAVQFANVSVTPLPVAQE